MLQLADVVAEDKVSRGVFRGRPASGRPWAAKEPSARRMQNRRQKRVCVTRAPGAHTWDSADSAESGNNIGSIWKRRLGRVREQA